MSTIETINGRKFLVEPTGATGVNGPVFYLTGFGKRGTPVKSQSYVGVKSAAGWVTHRVTL